MWFIGVEVEEETSAPPPKKNPGSAPARPYRPSFYAPLRNGTRYFPIWSQQRSFLGLKATITKSKCKERQFRF